MTLDEVKTLVLDREWPAVCTPTLGDNPHRASIRRRLAMRRRYRSLTTALSVVTAAAAAEREVFKLDDLHGELQDDIRWADGRCVEETMLLQKFILQHQQCVLAAR